MKPELFVESDDDAVLSSIVSCISGIECSKFFSNHLGKSQLDQKMIVTDFQTFAESVLGMKGPDSLEQTIREERTSATLPVITIGSLDRLDEQAYREGCATRLVEIALDLDAYTGVTRLFIP